MSILAAIGADVKKVFAWIGSPTGQKTIVTGEAVVESVYPAATGLISILNTWTVEIVKSEALAAAAGVQTGSGSQKAAAVLNVMTPEILAFAASQKLPIPNAATIAEANTKLVEFLNIFGAPAAAPEPAKTA